MQTHSVGKYGVMLEETECCGDGWINKTTHICCQNTPQSRGNGPTSCYGNQTYDTTRQVVCGNGLHNIENGKTECCQGRLINPNQEPCCSDFNHLEHSPFSCCGYGWNMEIYDPTEMSCVDGERMEIPEITAPTRIWRKCGETTYADTLDLCCNDQLTPRFSDSACCGSESYRSDAQFCIDTTQSFVIDKIAPNAEICTTAGQAVDLQYDPETQTCCRSPYLDYTHWTVFNSTEGVCCVLSETEVKFTDPSKETCCKAGSHQKVHSIPVGEGECCGPEMLIKGKQLCDTAMGEVVDIPENHPNHNDICVPNDRTIEIRQTYDNQREFCSNRGEIIPRAEGKDLCGGQIYDLDTHGCCNQYIYRLVTQQCCGESVVQPLVNDEGLPLKCCGVQAYHTGTSTCNAKSVIDDIPENNARFCGNLIYDDSMYDCIDKRELVPQGASPHIKLCGRTRMVYDDRLQECCGEDLIGPGQTCCHGYQYETPGTTLNGGKCCGATGYNPSIHSCCIGSLSPILGMVEPACCMHQAYDLSVSNITCCGGKLSRKTLDETECSVADGVVHRPDEIVCNSVRYPAGHMQCCGTDLYDPTTELCCEGFRYDKGEDDVCCGNKPYQNATGHLCCDGTLHTQAEGKECCNHAAYYPSTHQCFTTGGQNVIIEHIDNTPTSATDAFCTDGSYSPMNQTCCDGLLYNGLQECCGNRVIDSSAELCCDDVVQRKLFGNESQCCPSGQVVHQSWGCDAHHSDFDYQLCNETQYFPHFQGCCAGVVYSRSDAECRDDEIFFLCGDELYSKEEKTCCNGSLQDVPNGQCCKNEAFNPNSSVCCEGKVRRIRRGRDQCCGAMAFNVKREMCCETGPMRMPKLNQRIQTKMQNGICCGKGSEPNFTTRRCEEVPTLCRGLENNTLWKEAADDCTIDFTFSFIARSIDTNDTHTVIEIVGLHHLQAHNSNINLETLILPVETNCRKLKEGETYITSSSGDVEGSSLFLRNEDFLGKYQRRIERNLLRRTCL